jgi:hypothetical protein
LATCAAATSTSQTGVPAMSSRELFWDLDTGVVAVAAVSATSAAN